MTYVLPFLILEPREYVYLKAGLSDSDNTKTWGLHGPNISGPQPARPELISLLPARWKNHLSFVGPAQPVRKNTCHLPARPGP